MKKLCFCIIVFLASQYGYSQETPIYGVTIDCSDNLADCKENTQAIIESLEKLPVKPTTRVVFQMEPPADYLKMVEEIHKVSDVMGGLLDSYHASSISLHQYIDRTTNYFDLLGDQVDVWEIGNEVNGHWLGHHGNLKEKVVAAYTLAKSRGIKTALTLHYNEGCYSNPHYEMFNWADTQLSQDMKTGLDYVFVSYYPDDCPGSNPNWQQVFIKLHKIFPKAKIGFGEIGTKDPNKKAALIRDFYTMEIDVPNYVGGYFYWYFKQDMVPYTKPLWSVLDQTIQSKLPMKQDFPENTSESVETEQQPPHQLPDDPPKD